MHAFSILVFMNNNIAIQPCFNVMAERCIVP